MLKRFSESLYKHIERMRRDELFSHLEAIINLENEHVAEIFFFYFSLFIYLFIMQVFLIDKDCETITPCLSYTNHCRIILLKTSPLFIRKCNFIYICIMLNFNEINEGDKCDKCSEIIGFPLLFVLYCIVLYCIDVVVIAPQCTATF